MKPSVLLFCGYIGFGKTTVAKQFEHWGYVRYTHDDYMVKLFNDHQDNEQFMSHYNEVLDYMFIMIEKDLKQGKNLILDFGLWNKQQRKEIVNRLLKITKDINITFINIICSMDVARDRCINRDKYWKEGELWVPVSVFDMKLNQYEPITSQEFPFASIINIETD